MFVHTDWTMFLSQDHEEDDYYEGEDLDLPHGGTIALVNKTVRPAQPVLSEREDPLSRETSSSSSSSVLSSSTATSGSTARLEPEIPPVIITRKYACIASIQTGFHLQCLTTAYDKHNITIL